MSYRFDKINYLGVQDKRRRSAVRAQEFRRKLLKSMARDTRLPKDVRHAAGAQLALLPKNSNPARMIHRCVVTGRSRAVARRLKRVRGTARARIHEGRFPGVGKASW